MSQAPKHDPHQSDVDPGLFTAGEHLIVLGEPTPGGKPGEGALNNPMPSRKLCNGVGLGSPRGMNKLETIKRTIKPVELFPSTTEGEQQTRRRKDDERPEYLPKNTSSYPALYGWLLIYGQCSLDLFWQGTSIPLRSHN